MPRDTCASLSSLGKGASLPVMGRQCSFLSMLHGTRFAQSVRQSARGVFNQQSHGSKRSLRSVEDFTEFEQRTAYFNGDPIRPMKIGFQELPRSVIPHMVQAQNMLDFPPAPKLNRLGRLNDSATDQEKRGEKLFFGKAQ